MSDENEKPKVGYKNPPVETRFQPGQSGNPSGKKKKKLPTTMEEVRLAVLAKPISFIKGGKRVTMSLGEAVYEKAVMQALNGDVSAMKLCITPAKCSPKAETRTAGSEMTESDEAIIERFKAEVLASSGYDGGCYD